MLRIHQLSARNPSTNATLKTGVVLIADGTGSFVQSDTSTDAVFVPAGTDLQRPTLAAGEYAVRFNTDSLKIEAFDGVAWGVVGFDGTQVAEAMTVATDGQTAFTLAVAPSTARWNSFGYATVNGLTYKASHFTLAGTTLTWAGPYALTTHDELVVYYVHGI